MDTGVARRVTNAILATLAATAKVSALAAPATLAIVTACATKALLGMAPALATRTRREGSGQEQAARNVKKIITGLVASLPAVVFPMALSARGAGSALQGLSNRTVPAPVRQVLDRTRPVLTAMRHTLEITVSSYVTDICPLPTRRVQVTERAGLAWLAMGLACALTAGLARTAMFSAPERVSASATERAGTLPLATAPVPAAAIVESTTARSAVLTTPDRPARFPVMPCARPTT